MIDKFRQSFREEARELLTELESALLELDGKREDREVVGRAFRALHTIKGSGAMFGYDDIASFAHNLETAFDRLRNGQLAATADLINLTLAAGDHIKSMLEVEDGGTPVDADTSERILSDLRRLTGSSETDGEPPAAAPAPVTGDALAAWRIHFRPAAEILLHGMNPALLLRELRGLGRLEIALDTSAIPPLAELQAEQCYLAWNLVLTTAATRESIRDVFIFVEDDCELAIERLSEEIGDAPTEAGSIAAEGTAAAPKVREAAAGSVPATPASLRVSTCKLDELVNLVGELVTVQARLSEIVGRQEDAELRDVSEAVDRVTAALRENSMSIRMLPLRATFERFRRLVHDLGVDLRKVVDLTVEGADTELDKTVIDQLNDPLVHLIRNSMDHGIESSQERRAAGKNPTGTIHLSARHSGASVLIQVADDGKGMDHEAVRARAVEKGLIEAGTRLSEAETLALIMSPGFSTARQVSDVSGRGVGMDVVRRNIEALRGSVEIASRPGEGLTVTLRLPLTLAIIDGLLVRVGGAHFVLPLAHCRECVELTRQDVQAAHGRHLATLRGEIIPYLRLSEMFQMDSVPPEREQIMVVETDHGQYGFVVDEVLGDHQTVIKNLGRLYRNVQVISGATILGNGTVALILDPSRLVQNALHGVGQKLRSSDWSLHGNRLEPATTNTKETQIDGRQTNRQR